MVTRKHYSNEFKLEASKLVVERGYSLAEAGQQLGVNKWTVRSWVDKFRNEGILAPKGQVVPEAMEMKTLRKEVADLKMENQILKKAAAYFARDHL